MKKKLLVLSVLSLLVFSGCGKSANPYFTEVGISFEDSTGYSYDLYADPYGWLYFRPQALSGSAMLPLLGEDGLPTKDYTILEQYDISKEE